MCLPFDHSPAFMTALECLHEERLGVWTGAESVLMIPGPPRDNWYYRREVAIGGAVLDCLVYPVSRLVSMFGPALKVTGFLNTLIPHRIVGGGHRVESDVDDNVALLIEWPTDQVAVARTLWGTSFTRNDTVVFGRKATLWLSGGQVVLHAPDRAPVGGEPVDWQGLEPCFRLPVAGGGESIVDHFVECIRSGAQPRCSGRLQLHVHEILFAGWEAARDGRARELETQFAPWHEHAPSSFRDTRRGYL
jgi:predicted dehydrogenase